MDPEYVRLLLSQPTPILKDLCSYYGLAFSYPEVDPVHDYPLVIELDTRCWLFETIHGCLLKHFDASGECKYRFWVYIPWSVNECMRSFRSFMGFFYVRVEYPLLGTCVDLFHGINYLPLGPFIRGDVGMGILGRIMVKGKEKFFTAFESISPDVPCISRDNVLTTTRYRKYLPRCVGSNVASAAASDNVEVTTTRLWGASTYDGKRPLDDKARRSICCVFKSYATTEHVPVNIVRGYISGAPVPITVVSTYSPHRECTVLDERDERFLAKYYPRLAAACRMVRMQLDSCTAGYKGVSNTNSYAYKTVKQPSHVFMDHVQKQLRKNMRTLQCFILPAAASAKQLGLLATMLRVEHANANVMTPHYSRFVLSATSESPMASLINEYRVVVNFHKTTKQSYMRQVQTSQYGYVSPIATPDGSEIGMTKHLMPETEFSFRLLASTTAATRTRVLSWWARRTTDVAAVADRVMCCFNNEPIGDMTVSVTEDSLAAFCLQFPHVAVHYEPRVALLLSVSGGTLYNAKRGGTLCHPSRPFPSTATGDASAGYFGAHNDAARNTLGFGMVKQAMSRGGMWIRNGETKALLLDPYPAYSTEAVVLPMAVGSCVEDGVVLRESFTRRAAYIHVKRLVVPANSCGCLTFTERPPECSVAYEKDVWGVPPGTAIVRRDQPIVVVELPSKKAYVSVFAGKRGVIGYAFQHCYWIPNGGCAGGGGGINAQSRLAIAVTKCGIPTLGYKFATPHGQKGVVCRILPDLAMPRGEIDGLVPDAIVHPVTILSRLTVGQLKRPAGALQRFSLPSAAFPAVKDGDVTLHAIQAHYTPLFQQRNVPEDKFHFRDRLNVYNTFTRQPTEGRANDGSARMGEMECSAIHATGATQSLLLLGTHVDTTHNAAKLCADCGMISIFCGSWLGDGRKAHCRHDNVEIDNIPVKYAGILTAHILAAMRIAVTVHSDQPPQSE